MDYFVFDDIDTRDYEGIYVFPSKVDNTPKRVYETKNIVGRDGALYIDQGRYEDVAQTYSIAALTKQVGSEFINALASKVGYFRLSDSFNPTEFYSAVFTSGAEVKIEKEREKNVFSITFTRKPQRFLVSGETEVTVEDEDSITNPTQFDAKPLLHVYGNGNLNIGTQTISIADTEIGELLLANASEIDSQTKVFTTLDEGNLANMNSGDIITVGTGSELFINLTAGGGSHHQQDCTITLNSSSEITVTGIRSDISSISNRVHRITLDSFDFTHGGTDTTSYSVKVDAAFDVSTTHYTSTVSIQIVYDRSTKQISVGTITTSPQIPETLSFRLVNGWSESYGTIRSNLAQVTGDSTKSIEDMYIDLDIGEAYAISEGVISNTNNLVSMPADLPVLSKGDTTISFDDTFTQVDIVPRWWKV